MSATSNQTLVLSKIQIEQTINRIAYQIYEDCANEKEILIAGISPNGFLLAQKLTSILEKISSIKGKLIEVNLDKENPIGTEVKLTPENIELKDKVIILVDDVLNSGKTLMYSLSPFLKVPIKKIRTVLLVDRNHKRYPIAGDFVGISLATTMQEHISVVLEGEEAVYLI